MFALLFGGCVGSIVETGEVDRTVADAGAEVACDPQGAAAGAGHHNPGTPCLSCHTAGGTGPAFTLAGTVFDGLAGDAPMAGISVRLRDADGTELSLTTSENGNFWTSQALTFPVTTSTSNCPNTHPMLSPVQQSGGDCNSAGCHVAGFRIHAQ